MARNQALLCHLREGMPGLGKVQAVTPGQGSDGLIHSMSYARYLSISN